MTETEIDGRIIPIKAGPKTILTFSAGRVGPDEAGDWEFWTVVHLVHGQVARCRAGAADPGERFRRMEGLKEYESAWETARRADYLRPATAAELVGWLDSHRSDACFAESGQVEGRMVRIVEKDGRYSLVATS